MQSYFYLVFRLIYVTDWFATFLQVAGLKHLIPEERDSLSAWRVISRGKRSKRKEIVLNIDKDDINNLWSGAVRSGDYKLIWGQSKLLKQKHPELRDQRQLFNVIQDPGERNNLAAVMPDKVKELEQKILGLLDEMSPARYSHGIRKGWPGLGKGDEKGVFRTNWCKPIV